MTVSLAELQKLSVSERLALIEALWDSIADAADAPGLSDEQRQAIDWRVHRNAHNAPQPTATEDSDEQPGRYVMRIVKHRSKAEEQALIEKYVGLDYERYGGRADARLKSGPSIWAIVAFLDIYEGDLDEIAGHFDIRRTRSTRHWRSTVATRNTWTPASSSTTRRTRVAQLSLDHNVSLKLAPLLEQAGHGVLTTRDIGGAQLTDDALLLASTQAGSVFITHNRDDFRMLHDAWIQASGDRTLHNTPR